MRELLRALLEQLLFFLDPCGYKLVDSDVGSTYGDASLSLENDRLVWRLVRDRSQVFLECRPPDGPDDRWYSTDLLVRLLTGQRMETAELTHETAHWVKQHLDEIEARFAPAAKQETLCELQDLKRRRAKELFG